MPTTILAVKNMVCYRCVMSVKSVLDELKVPYNEVVVGEIHLDTPLSSETRKMLNVRLKTIGLELINSKVGGLIEKIKQLIILKARNEIGIRESKLKLSSYLTELLHYDYSYISSVFSEVEGRTIENYFIEQRIEKAKELLVYGEHNLSEIAIELDFSSVAHLSAQFKKVTGLTPSHFKSVGAHKRKTIDQV